MNFSSFRAASFSGVLAACAAMLAFQGAAHAAGPVPAPAAASPVAHASAVRMAASSEAGVPQRNKMKSCNAEAKQKNLHGPERRAFMKQCLSKGATAS